MFSDLVALWFCVILCIISQKFDIFQSIILPQYLAGTSGFVISEDFFRNSDISFVSYLINFRSK
jgi:hypothetical protein